MFFLKLKFHLHIHVDGAVDTEVVDYLPNVITVNVPVLPGTAMVTREAL